MMTRTCRIYCCCLLVVLSSCSLPLAVKTDHIGGTKERSGTLWNIRIERWGEVLFSGLLAIRESRDLSYILLDATGVKLLQARVPGDGDDLQQVRGPLKDSELAPFLSEALFRIYRQEPGTLPCAGSWFYSLCREESGGVEEKSWRKYLRTGFMTIWQASSRRAPREGNEKVYYNQPWLGVSITLERMSPGKQ